MAVGDVERPRPEEVTEARARLFDPARLGVTPSSAPSWFCSSGMFTVDLDVIPPLEFARLPELTGGEGRD